MAAVIAAVFALGCGKTHVGTFHQPQPPADRGPPSWRYSPIGVPNAGLALIQAPRLQEPWFGDPGPRSPESRRIPTSDPFDRGAAVASLGGVNVQPCARLEGPKGSGHVTLVYGPEGIVTSVVVDGGPFQGTPVAACIANKFRASRVPTFEGGPVTVGKSFILN